MKDLYKLLSEEEKVLLRDLIAEEESKKDYRVKAGEWLLLDGCKAPYSVRNLIYESKRSELAPKIYWFVLEDVVEKDIMMQNGAREMDWELFVESRNQYFENENYKKYAN